MAFDAGSGTQVRELDTEWRSVHHRERRMSPFVTVVISLTTCESTRGTELIEGMAIQIRARHGVE